MPPPSAAERHGAVSVVRSLPTSKKWGRRTSVTAAVLMTTALSVFGVGPGFNSPRCVAAFTVDGGAHRPPSPGDVIISPEVVVASPETGSDELLHHSKQNRGNHEQQQHLHHHQPSARTQDQMTGGSDLSAFDVDRSDGVVGTRTISEEDHLRKGDYHDATMALGSAAPGFGVGADDFKNSPTGGDRSPSRDSYHHTIDQSAGSGRTVAIDEIEEPTRSMGRVLTETERVEYSRDFVEFDLNKDQLIDAEELRVAFASEIVHPHELFQFFLDVDMDNSGAVTLNEYLDYAMLITT